jgi:hypothetical protein
MAEHTVANQISHQDNEFGVKGTIIHNLDNFEGFTFNLNLKNPKNGTFSIFEKQKYIALWTWGN